MFKDGLRTNGGNQLVKSRLHNLLSDPFYCGKIRWNNEIYKGNHEPLVSEELFNTVQKILRGKSAPSYNKHFYLFRGTIKCSECRGRITWETHKNITYGHCTHYNNCSQEIWVKEPEMEKQITLTFDSLKIQNSIILEWVRKILIESHKEQIEYHLNALKKLNQRHEQIQNRLDRLYDDKIDGKITKDFYDRKLKAYSEEKELVLETIKKYSNASDKYLELGINFYELSQKASELYRQANIEEKRELFNIVFDSLLLDNGRLIIEYSKPFKLLSEAINASNSSKTINLAETQPEIFELANLRTKSTKNRAFDPALTPELQLRNDVRTCFSQ
jgi:hypothetical protein